MHTLTIWTIWFPIASQHRDSAYKDNKRYSLKYGYRQIISTGTTRPQCCIWHGQFQHISW